MTKESHAGNRILRFEDDDDDPGDFPTIERALSCSKTELTITKSRLLCGLERKVAPEPPEENGTTRSRTEKHHDLFL